MDTSTLFLGGGARPQHALTYWKIKLKEYESERLFFANFLFVMSAVVKWL